MSDTDAICLVFTLGLAGFVAAFVYVVLVPWPIRGVSANGTRGVVRIGYPWPFRSHTDMATENDGATWVDVTGRPADPTACHLARCAWQDRVVRPRLAVKLEAQWRGHIAALDKPPVGALALAETEEADRG